MNVIPNLILLIIGLSVSQNARSAKPCGIEALPLPARHIVISRFPHWKVVTTGDLVSDDQKLWTKAHGELCPGVIAGHFEGRSPSYAAALIKRSQSKLLQMLVVFISTDHGYVSRIIDSPSVVARPLVITKVPSGTYTSAERDKHVEIKFDGIQQEAIEAGATLFYWKNGKYYRLILSE